MNDSSLLRLALSATLLLAAACGDDDGTSTVSDTGVNLDVTEVADAESDAMSDAIMDAEPDVSTEPTSTLEFDASEAGPYGVGYRRAETTYSAPDGSERTIPIHVWYPTDDTEGDAPTYALAFSDPLVFEDATVADPLSGAFPVHVHSHGNLGFAATSAFLMRRFASHGWVAIAPDHVGDLLFDSGEEDTAALHLARPTDLSATLDWLAELPASDPLSASDTTNVVASGHSRGVTTMYAVGGVAYSEAEFEQRWPDLTEAERSAVLGGATDERITAVIGMAGTYSSSMFGDGNIGQMTLPFFAMGGDDDNRPAMSAQFDSAFGIVDMVWLQIAGGCHQAFALGGCANITNDLAYDIVSDYALFFARQQVLGDDSENTSATLAGEANVPPALTEFALALRED